MTLVAFLGMVALGLGSFAMILFPEVRSKTFILLRGASNVFIEDKAKTPEGAKALFQQAIQISEERYTKANELLRLRAGELEVAKTDILEIQNEIKVLEANCEKLVQKERYDDVNLFSAQRDEKLVDLERQKQLIENLEPVVEECKSIAQHHERTLHELKVKKKQVLSELEMNKQLTTMYDDLDGLKPTNNVDKLLESVNEGHRESRQKAIGAKVIHDNKLETKVNKVKIEMKNDKSSDYVDELKKKYGKV